MTVRCEGRNGDEPLPAWLPPATRSSTPLPLALSTHPPGIDIDSSSHVTVTGADVDTADDAICLKTTSPGHPLEHVAVSDCT